MKKKDNTKSSARSLATANKALVAALSTSERERDDAWTRLAKMEERGREDTDLIRQLSRKAIELDTAKSIWRARDELIEDLRTQISVLEEKLAEQEKPIAEQRRKFDATVHDTLEGHLMVPEFRALAHLIRRTKAPFATTSALRKLLEAQDWYRRAVQDGAASGTTYMIEVFAGDPEPGESVVVKSTTWVPVPLPETDDRMNATDRMNAAVHDALGTSPPTQHEDGHVCDEPVGHRADDHG